MKLLFNEADVIPRIKGESHTNKKNKEQRQID